MFRTCLKQISQQIPKGICRDQWKLTSPAARTLSNAATSGKTPEDKFVYFSEEDKQKLKENPNEKVLDARITRGQGAAGTMELGGHEQYDIDRHTWRYTLFMSNPANDGWMARQVINDLMSHPVLPEPEVTIEVLKSCRRMNDYALAVRYLEGVQSMMASKKKAIWPWYQQEIQETLTELGVLTPEEMGYDKPEFFMFEPEDY